MEDILINEKGKRVRVEDIDIKFSKTKGGVEVKANELDKQILSKSTKRIR